MLPECLARSSSDCVLLCVVKGGSHRPAVSPFLIVCHFPRMNGRPSSCQIWELTKFDRVQFWSNIYDFSIDELGIYPHFFYSVGGVMIRNRRGSLLIIVQGQLVYSLDLETQILIQLPIAEGGLWTLYPAYYAESLFLLDKVDDILSYWKGNFLPYWLWIYLLVHIHVVWWKSCVLGWLPWFMRGLVKPQ